MDAETTGFDPAADRVVEVAVVRVTGDGRVLGEASTLVDPGVGIPADASGVHGIVDEDVRDAPAFSDLAPELVQLLDGAVVVTHNLWFDGAFLAAEFARAGVRVPVLPALCTQITAYGQLMDTRRKLGSLHLLMFRKRVRHAHTALGDARATAAVLEQLVRHAPCDLRYVGDIPVGKLLVQAPETFRARIGIGAPLGVTAAPGSDGDPRWHQHWQPQETPAELCPEWLEVQDIVGIETVTPPALDRAAREEVLSQRARRTTGFGLLSDHAPERHDSIIDRVVSKYRGFTGLAPERKSELRALFVARLADNGADLTEAYEHVLPEASRRWACPRDVKMHRVGMECDTLEWPDKDLKGYLQDRLRGRDFEADDPLPIALKAALTALAERQSGKRGAKGKDAGRGH
ncbi:3'-5' exonuclease [Streptomyces hiroshimensis]|uniref:3'-5' exonuclease n=1 Tax=Streptomyces hiroshimensis TaxID=66424 RepID=UPI0016725F89|nr:3'-5' exonuclease [Streptomyces hiroshimensis]